MKTAVTIKNLVKDYGTTRAVNQLNITVPEGSIYGFLGPNGAGKTTTLKMIVGMTEPTSGEIEIFGEKLTFGSSRYRDEIGYLPDVPGFYDWMTANEFLKFSGSLYQVPKDILSDRIKELLSLVGMTKHKNKKIGTFSRGMKQRLGIAQALINNPKIILLDEPVSALDPIGRKEVMDIIESLAGKVTVFFSSHILADVERICDQIVIIKDGKVMLEDSIENIKNIATDREIEIELDDHQNEDFLTQIKNQNSVLDVNSERNKIIIRTNDIDQVRFDIMSLIYEHKYTINKFVIKEATLEDIFIKVVNGNA